LRVASLEYVKRKHASSIAHNGCLRVEQKGVEPSIFPFEIVPIGSVPQSHENNERYSAMEHDEQLDMFI